MNFNTNAFFWACRYLLRTETNYWLRLSISHSSHKYLFIYSLRNQSQRYLCRSIWSSVGLFSLTRTAVSVIVNSQYVNGILVQTSLKTKDSVKQKLALYLFFFLVAQHFHSLIGRLDTTIIKMVIHNIQLRNHTNIHHLCRRRR